MKESQVKAQPMYTQTTPEINDQALQKAIRHALRDHPYLDLLTTPIKIDGPYREFFHYRKELHTYIDSPERSPKEKERLQTLTDFIDDNMKSTRLEYEKHVLHGNVTLDFLWTLYPLNSLIVTRDDEIRRCFRVEEYKTYELSCYYWSYLNGRFGRSKHTVRFPNFEGLRKITRLKAVPFDFLPDEEQRKLRKDLIKRGQKWQTLCFMSHMNHNGKRPGKSIYKIH